MYGEQDLQGAINYANQANQLTDTTSKGVVKITMRNDLRVYNVPPFSITRITKEQIEQLQQQGYDLIAGSMIGRMEYVLLNKDKIVDMNFEPLQMQQKLTQNESVPKTQEEKKSMMK